MSYWDLLGITPTDEISVIKKAYAKKLKIYHPEDDPEGFQRLKEAYDAAVRYVTNLKGRQTHTILVKDREESVNVETNSPIYDSHNEQIELTQDNNLRNVSVVDLKRDFWDEQESQEQAIDKFMLQVEDLYNDFFSRIEIKNWHELLNRDILWDFEYKGILNNRMLEFLLEHHHLPKEVWRILNSIFNWDEQLEYLSSYYPKRFINYITTQLSQGNWLRYSYFNGNKEIDYDKYIEFRDIAYSSLLYDNYEFFTKNLDLAYEIYQDDPDLFLMKADYYYRIGHKENGKAALQHAIEINNKDIDTYYFIAEILNKHKETNQVSHICKQILARNPAHVEARNLLINITNTFQLKLRKKPLNVGIRNELKEIYQILGDSQIKYKHRVTYFDFFKWFLFAILKILLYILSFVFAAVLMIASKGLLIPFILGMFIYRLTKK